jgi:hypothetical protein
LAKNNRYVIVAFAILRGKLCHQLPDLPINALTDNDDEEDNLPDDCRRPAIIVMIF